MRPGHRRPLLRRVVGPGHRPRLPEAAAGGDIGLVENGDEILIDVKTRTLKVLLDDETLAERRAKMEASERPWQPKDRQRPVTQALRAYAKLATSADKGAVRSVD